MSGVVIALQARTGSTRLPGKVVRPLLGRPMLEYQLERLRGLDLPVVVATSDLDRDDEIAELASRAGVACVRGSESDVLSRFGAVLDSTGADTLVRLTGDCPFTDPAVVAAAVERHRTAGADYTSNVRPRTYPHGLDVEVVRATSLREAIAEADDPREREHVMPFLYRRPDRYVLVALVTEPAYGDRHWTVDTADDFARVEALAEQFAPRVDAGWEELLAAAPDEPTASRSGLRLRPATVADDEFILALRNDDDAVRWSTTAAGVTEADHHPWFRARLADPACRLRVVEVDGEPAGQVRVDVEDVATGVVSVAVTPKHRGRGIAHDALRALQADLAGDVQLDRLVAVVHVDHAVSRRVFESVGFVTLSDRPHDGDFVSYEWTQAPSPERRKTG